MSNSFNGAMTAIQDYGTDQYETGYKAGWAVRDKEANDNFIKGLDAGRQEMAAELRDRNHKIAALEATLKSTQGVVDALKATRLDLYEVFRKIGIVSVEYDHSGISPKRDRCCLTVNLACGSEMKLYTIPGVTF